MDPRQRFAVRPGEPANILQRPTDETPGIADRDEADARLDENREKTAALQHKLWAQNTHALLVVFQAMDAGGKDGTIRRVFSGINPTGVNVTSFKQPTHEEADHDFLWRIHRAVPGHGEIGIFNRSHYEDVLVVRVKNLAPDYVWRPRFEAITAFERFLNAAHTTVIKIFLHISKGEQKSRLEKRIHDPRRNWKFTQSDLDERSRWDDYAAAYEEAITRTSTAEAPWYVIPADKKWYRNAVVSQIILETLEEMNPQYPPPREDISKLKVP